MKEIHFAALASLCAGALAIAFAPVLARLAVLVDGGDGAAVPLSPVGSAFWRTALAAPVFWGMVLLHQRRSPDSPPLAAQLRAAGSVLVLPGLFFAADLGCWHWAFEYTTVGNATLEANLGAVLVSLVGWLWFRERLTLLFPVGVLIALGGMTGLIGFDASTDPLRLRGDLLGLATACCYAGYLVFTKILTSRMGVALAMAVSTTVCSLALLLAGLAGTRPMVPADTGAWVYLVLLALGPQVLGQGLIARGLDRLPASFSAVTLLLQPVLTYGLGWLILDQPLTPVEMLWSLTVIAGIFLAQRSSRPG